MEFDIPKFSDKDLLANLVKSATEIGGQMQTYSLNTSLGNHFNQTAPNFDLADQNLTSLLEMNTEILTSGSIQFIFLGPTLGISFHRNIDKPFDKVTIPIDTLVGDQYLELKIRMVASTRKNLRAIHSSEQLRKNLSDEAPSYSVRENELLRLEQIARNLIQDQEKYRQSLEEKFLDRQGRLEEGFQKKFEDLETEKSDLALQKKELDDRESRHARREIQKKLNDVFTTRAREFKLSEGTQNLRNPIRNFTLTLLFLFGLGLLITFLTSFKIFGSQPESSDLIGIRISFGLAFTATALFFIRWQNRWFEQHSKEEFDLKRLEIDLHRASWAVELAMEWKKENSESIPSDIFAQLSKNLFISSDENIPNLHPADQLASAILGASAKAKLPLPGGGEIELDKRGIRQLSKN